MSYLKTIVVAAVAIVLWAVCEGFGAVNGWWSIAPAGNARLLMDAAVEIVKTQNRGNKEPPGSPLPRGTWLGSFSLNWQATNRHIRFFLLQTSILEKLSPPLCDIVTGQRNSYQRLLELESNNFFGSTVSQGVDPLGFRYGCATEPALTFSAFVNPLNS
ncbi:hypothetical protein KFU94_52265 [Chloroflexi bacterium TSY]|nr:hypothetical protein [Chloroflexi bacterium TSY]